MKSSLKNTIILLFRRIDKAVFDLHRTRNAWISSQVPSWVLFLLGLGLYVYLIWLLLPMLFSSGIPFFQCVGFILFLACTLLFLLYAKSYVSQLLHYKSPYIRQNERYELQGERRKFGTPPFRFLPEVYDDDFTKATIFRDYIQTSQEDILKFLSGNQVSEKLVWLPLTDRKLSNFRLLFEFLNRISEENLEGYYGENLVHLCNFILLNFKSKDGEWSVKQLQKAHSGWKNCNPKRRMDLKIDIENHLVFLGRPKNAR